MGIGLICTHLETVSHSYERLLCFVWKMDARMRHVGAPACASTSQLNQQGADSQRSHPRSRSLLHLHTRPYVRLHTRPYTRPFMRLFMRPLLRFLPRASLRSLCLPLAFIQHRAGGRQVDILKSALCLCAYSYACMHIHMHACIFICMYAYSYACMHIHMHVCIFICMYAYSYACMHIHMHACIFICMYLHSLSHVYLLVFCLEWGWTGMEDM